MIYLVDTNVISELRRAPSGRANLRVVDWQQSVSPASVFVSVITLFELELGVLQMERRDAVQGLALRAWLENQVLPSFEGQILPIDDRIARRCAGLHVPDPQPEGDALIAATALVHSMTLVTRNPKDFAATGVNLLNPWD